MRDALNCWGSATEENPARKGFTLSSNRQTVQESDLQCDKPPQKGQLPHGNPLRKPARSAAAKWPHKNPAVSPDTHHGNRQRWACACCRGSNPTQHPSSITEISQQLPSRARVTPSSVESNPGQQPHGKRTVSNTQEASEQRYGANAGPPKHSQAASDDLRML